MMRMNSQSWDEVINHIRNLINADKKKNLLIAIDGKCGSGKTALANCIQKELGGNLFHMDDFFLRPEQRTKERMQEVGGNVDYERFGEVIEQILDGRNICYQAYDCKEQKLKNTVCVEAERLNIVEGAYSMHPYFRDVYDMKIFMDIEEELQEERILRRNGAWMLKRFREEWIPKENAYFEKFCILEKSDIKVKS